MKRPLRIVAVLFAVGVMLGNYVPFPLPCLFAVSFAFLAGTILLPRLRVPLLWPFLIFTGWTNFAYHTAILSPTDLRLVLTEPPILVSLRGILAETPTERIYPGDPKDSIRTMSRLNLTALQTGTNWQPASGQIEIITSSSLPGNLFKGQAAQVYGVLDQPSRPLAEGLFDYRTYLQRQEIYFELKAKSSNDWQIVGPPKILPPLSDRFTKWAKTALALGLPETNASLRLEQALALGDKTYLTDDVTEPFVRASTYHIFAVDGLRLAILFGIFFKTLRWLHIPRIASGLLLIPLFWFYVALTGWSPSAIRAAVMLTIVIFGWMLKRPVDVLNSLFAAAFLLLLWRPQQLFQAGFQLSFFVVLCIFAVMPHFDNFVRNLLKEDPFLPENLRSRWQWRNWLRFALDLFFSSLAAWIGSIPLVAYYFHIFTPISAPANVLAVFLCLWLLICNVISLLLAGWFPAGALVFNYSGSHLMGAIHAMSIWFAKLPYAYSYVATPGIFSICVYYAILLAVVTGWLFKPAGRKWKFTALFLLLAAWTGQHLHNRSITRLTILPLNGGDAIYCDAPGIKNDLLIDCGNDHAVNFVMKPYLRAQGVNSLPCLALTHGDAQQVGGFAEFQALFPIEKVVTSSVRFRSPAYREAIQLTKPERKREVTIGDQFCNWTVLHPAATSHFPHADDNALVLLSEIRGTRILLLSDLGRPGQEALLERHADLHADIVISGLPEQNEPLTDALLDVIHPALIIIADSKAPATRRANRTLRKRLEKRRVPVLYTSDLGAVKISFHQNTWEAETVDGTSWAGSAKN